jgi:hypothetical protein
MDSDGSAISFDMTSSSGPGLRSSCAADLTRQDEELVAALDAADHWSVDSQDAIVLKGGHEVRLQRVQASGG